MTMQPVVDPDVLSALRGRLRGPLLLPDTEAAACIESATIWNGMVQTRPAMVVRPTGTADVVECVRFAAAHQVPIAPKGGGHNLSGTCLPANGLTVDLCRLKGVQVDTKQ